MQTEPPEPMSGKKLFGLVTVVMVGAVAAGLVLYRFSVRIIFFLNGD